MTETLTKTLDYLKANIWIFRIVLCIYPMYHEVGTEHEPKHEEMVASIHEPYLAWRSILSFCEEFKWEIDTFKASWSRRVGWQNLRPCESHTNTADCRPTELLLREAQVDENSSDTSPEKPTTRNSILEKADKRPNCAKHCHNSVFLKTKMSFPENGRKKRWLYLSNRKIG